MMVECFLGGFRGRFDQGENTKEVVETRTPVAMWPQDTSLYGRVLSEQQVAAINDPLTRKVAEQDLVAWQARRNFKRTTQPPSFGDYREDY